MSLRARKYASKHISKHILSDYDKNSKDDLPEINNEIQVGQIVTRAVNKIEQKSKHSIPEIKRGTVVYIHPERRFYIAKFELDSGETYYESYLDCRPSTVDWTNDVQNINFELI